MSRLAHLLPYYINHLVIACVLSLVTQTPLAGAFFYIGREVRDREKLGYWDWRGLLWPVVPLVALEIWLRVN